MDTKEQLWDLWSSAIPDGIAGPPPPDCLPAFLRHHHQHMSAIAEDSHQEGAEPQPATAHPSPCNEASSFASADSQPASGATAVWSQPSVKGVCLPSFPLKENLPSAIDMDNALLRRLSALQPSGGPKGRSLADCAHDVVSIESPPGLPVGEGGASGGQPATRALQDWRIDPPARTGGSRQASVLTSFPPEFPRPAVAVAEAAASGRLWLGRQRELPRPDTTATAVAREALWRGPPRRPAAPAASNPQQPEPAPTQVGGRRDKRPRRPRRGSRTDSVAQAPQLPGPVPSRADRAFMPLGAQACRSPVLLPLLQHAADARASTAASATVPPPPMASWCVASELPHMAAEAAAGWATAATCTGAGLPQCRGITSQATVALPWDKGVKEAQLASVACVHELHELGGATAGGGNLPPPAGRRHSSARKVKTTASFSWTSIPSFSFSACPSLDP